MVWIPLKNGEGQVVKDIKLKSPEGKEYTVAGSSRKGINRYELTLHDNNGKEHKVMNHELRHKWDVVGKFHSPEKLAQIYGRSKIDPDANKPRHMRASFWAMKSKPGTFNYKQKVKLMKDPVYIKSFKQYFKDTLVDK